MANPQQNAEDTVAGNPVRDALARRTPPVSTGTMTEDRALAEKTRQAERVARDNARILSERRR